MGRVVGGMGGVNVRMMLIGARLEDVERRFAAGRSGPTVTELREMAAEKLGRRSMLTRPEVAAYLGVSTKKLQRMEVAGTIQRCPNLGTVVRYAARDVLRLAVESRQRT